MKIGKRTIYADQIVLLVCLAVILLGAGVTYDSLNFKDSTISSKDDMTFQIDSDSNGANLYYWKNGAGTTLRAMNEAGDITQSFGIFTFLGSQMYIQPSGGSGFRFLPNSGGIEHMQIGANSSDTNAQFTLSRMSSANNLAVVDFKTEQFKVNGQTRLGSGSPAADRDTAAEAQLWVDGIAWADDGLAVGGNGSTSYGKILQSSGTFTDAYTTVASVAMGPNNGGGEQDTRSFLAMISLADGPNEDGETELLLITYQDEGGSETIAYSLISETGSDTFSTQAAFSGGNVLIQAKNDTASQDGTANVVFIMGSVFDN